MDSNIVCVTVFACPFGGALLGMWLHTILPEHHLDEETKETVKVGIGLIATMTALVLGLITASAKSSYDTIDSTVKNTAVDVLTLDRSLARYGPEASEIRKGLQRAIEARVSTIWPQDSSKPSNLDPMSSGGASAAEKLSEAIRALKPHGDSQEALRSRALDITETLLKERWLVLTGIESSVPLPFLMILVFWLTITFWSFGLFAPRNVTVLVVLFVCALSVASAVFLVMELNTPFEGLLKVSPEPFRYVIAHLNQ